MPIAFSKGARLKDGAIMPADADISTLSWCCCSHPAALSVGRPKGRLGHTSPCRKMSKNIFAISREVEERVETADREEGEVGGTSSDLSQKAR